jgi:hypothetical protein
MINISIILDELFYNLNINKPDGEEENITELSIGSSNYLVPYMQAVKDKVTVV